MHTERLTLRRDALSSIFNKHNITKTWRQTVRSQLRSFDFKDLFDHYDFNYNIEARAITIRNEILNGTYRVSLPLIYKLEKKYGVCRHMSIPQPTDALIMQILTNFASKQIIKQQPSKNAFYTRDKHYMRNPHEVAEYGLFFKEQWKELQKKIYYFNETKKLLVVTDLSNYYDSININELRKTLSNYISNNEVLIDILFQIVEEISWRPDYLPYSSKGLPTVNLEAIRLLAHSFLFEIDDVLARHTNDSFVRWMDDIVIGVDSEQEAITIISTISDMLKSRGLALNLSKTAIYNSEQASYHFQIEQNQYIDSLNKIKKDASDYNKVINELKTKFNKHFKAKDAKYWDKIAKRYITVFTKLESDKLLPKVAEIYKNYPILRPPLLIYLSKRGYKSNTAKVITEILSTLNTFDDISTYQICRLITEWEIPCNKKTALFLSNIEKYLNNKLHNVTPTTFYSILLFKVKYNSHEDLFIFIKKYENKWKIDSFLRRQVIAVMARLFISNEDEVKKILYIEISSGIINTVSIANQIQIFSQIDKIDNRLSFYLFPTNKQRPYPLSKFLVLCSTLNSKNIQSNETIKRKVLEHIKDPYFLKWLNIQYGIK